MTIQLGRRDKKSLILLAGFLAVYSLFQFAIYPVVSKRSKMKSALIDRKRDLVKITGLKTEYQGMKAYSDVSSSEIKNRKNNFTLFSYLEDLSGKANVKESISYMKPSSSTQKNGPYKLSIVEMKLQPVSLEQLINFLYNIETTEKSVSVTKVAISKEKKDGALSCVLQIETIEL
ncbi:MAG: type II secretion system protein M [Proteobacteria bacterium]|nr:type II secretion system protein M [Pseudomonadota bacterium]